jgi:hypothetical protein
MPALAPRAVPTMMAMGVASPSAQGQAMMSTATAFTSAKARRGSGPQMAQAAKAAAAEATTAGTNQPATASASRWTGARLRCASATIRTIWASSASFPTRSARSTKLPLPFTVPPVTRSPGPFSTGIGSPVTIDSSTEDRPSTTGPSTGTFSPGRTRSSIPGATCSSGISSSRPSSITCSADFGASASSARMAPETRLRARSSRICPSSTSSTITAADSK